MAQMDTRSTNREALDNLFAAAANLFERSRMGCRCYGVGPLGAMQKQDEVTYRVALVTRRDVKTRDKPRFVQVELEASNAVDAANMIYEHYGPCQIETIEIKTTCTRGDRC